jgi:hypothetical protein
MVYAYNDEAKTLLPQSAIETFMNHCAKRLGDEYFRTPGTTITSFINLLAVLEQNPGSEWTDLLDQVEIKKDEGGARDRLSADDDLVAC